MRFFPESLRSAKLMKQHKSLQTFYFEQKFCFVLKKLRSVSPEFKPVNQIALLYNTQEAFPDSPGWTISI